MQKVKENGVDLIVLNKAKHDGKAFSLINYFNELATNILDTYLVVLIAADEIISSNMVVKENSLVEQIHYAIIDLHNENLLPSIQSCLQVTIKTALHRFGTLNMLNVQTYRAENGSRVTYISGSQEQLPAVKASEDELCQIQSYQP